MILPTVNDNGYENKVSETDDEIVSIIEEENHKEVSESHIVDIENEEARSAQFVKYLKSIFTFPSHQLFSFFLLFLLIDVRCFFLSSTVTYMATENGTEDSESSSASDSDLDDTTLDPTYDITKDPDFIAMKKKRKKRAEKLISGSEEAALSNQIIEEQSRLHDKQMAGPSMPNDKADNQ